MQTVYDKRFGCKLLLHRYEHTGSDPILMHYWNGLTFHSYRKWHWFFRYRAALLQVKYPRRYVEWREFSYDYVPSAQEKAKYLKDRLIAKKGKLTNWINKLTAYEKAWNSLFPITDDLSYHHAVAKIDQLRYELKTMQEEYDLHLQANQL